MGLTILVGLFFLFFGEVNLDLAPKYSILRELF